MKNRIKLILKYGFFLSLTVLLIGAIVVRKEYPNAIGNLFKPVSVVSQVTSGVELKKTDGRTNILILGVDKRTAVSTSNHVLTDTIIVASLDETGEKPVIISVPRDLWVQQTKSKVNAVYASSGYSPEITVDAVEYIVGIPIHYFVVVGFEAFTDTIDVLGGLQIDVAEAFDDYKYPIEGMENAPNIEDRYVHIRFEQGPQLMNSETALQYARSRHSDNPNEAGDFARARRQQKVLMSFKQAILSTDTIFDIDKIKGLYDSYSTNIKTNISFPEAVVFFEKYGEIQTGNVKNIVLSDEPTSSDLPGSGTLIAPTEEERVDLYDGQYVLVPTDRSFDFVHAMVRSSLFD